MIHTTDDLIIVYCDHCASTIKLYASGLDESLDSAIKGAGWSVEKWISPAPDRDYVGFLRKAHACRACVRKGR